MKKFYKIITLILLLIFLTTYTPNTLFLFKENENSFFKITNIEITNNKKIEKKEIIDKLNHIYNKNILLVSADDIEEPLRKLDFLDNIKIKKKYPSTILICTRLHHKLAVKHSFFNIFQTFLRICGWSVIA